MPPLPPGAPPWAGAEELRSSGSVSILLDGACDAGPASASVWRGRTVELMRTYLPLVTDHADPSSGILVAVAVVGGIVGVIGLILSWGSGRAERAAARLSQLIDIEADATSRGPLQTDNLADLDRYASVLKELDEEIRLQQRFAIEAARRVGSGTSSFAAFGWLVYGVFLVAAAFHVDSSAVHRPVSDITAGMSWAFALIGVGCVSRAIVLAFRRYRIWKARRDTGIRDTYSRESVAALRRRWADRRRAPDRQR